MHQLDKLFTVLVGIVSVFDVGKNHTVLLIASMFVIGIRSLVMSLKQTIGSMPILKRVQNVIRPQRRMEDVTI